MKNLVFTSLRRDAGKTGIMVGLASVWDKKIDYMKPFGDRLLYRKKKLWDFDSAIFTNLFGIDENVEDMSIGFDHSKLRYMYDEESLKAKLQKMAEHNSMGKDVLFVESGNNINFGMTVHLDAVSICKAIGGTLYVVTHGNDDKIVDDLTFLKKGINLEGVDFGGVIINKVKDVENFKSVNSQYLTDQGINVLGVIPEKKELSFPTVEFFSEILFAKVLAGESQLQNKVREIFVGAMSADAVVRMRELKREDKVIITSGDRSDMILAAIDTHCVGIILTNNILPPPNIIARASHDNIPLLLTQGDTYSMAKKIDQSVPLLRHTDKDKINMWAKLVRDYLDWEKIG